MKERSNISIAISWNRLPPYAARLIRSGIDSMDISTAVIASKPVALIKEVEEIIEQPICWVDSNLSYTWSDLGLETPDIFFQSGWLNKVFKDLGSQVKKAGGKVVCFSDNSWKNTPRQWLGSLGFRIKYRPKFDAVWVPGKSGTQLMKFYGMSNDRIYQGMYGADSQLFSADNSLKKREKKIIFVGQLIERKGIATLVSAFQKFYQDFPDWTLHVIGSGPLEYLLNKPGIYWEGFHSPLHVAEAMRNSRFLVLPSQEDHWGLVVHEAACSGCGLIVSNTVGAALDLVTRANGIRIPPNSEKDLYDAFTLFAEKNDYELDEIYDKSLSLAKSFGANIWADTFKSVVNELGFNSIN